MWVVHVGGAFPGWAGTALPGKAGAAVRVRLENGRMSDLEFLNLSKEDQGYVVEAMAAPCAEEEP